MANDDKRDKKKTVNKLFLNVCLEKQMMFHNKTKNLTLTGMESEKSENIQEKNDEKKTKIKKEVNKIKTHQ